MNTTTQTLTIVALNTKPQHDPYTNIEGVYSTTYLKLDPRDMTVWVEQEYKDNSTPSDEWHGLVLTWGMGVHPSEAGMKGWIEENMNDLLTICNGYEEEWNGSNHVGMLTTDEARSAHERIEFALDNYASVADYYEIWTVESWLESSLVEITAETTDEELAGYADSWEPISLTILDGDILTYITGHRDDLVSDKADEE